MFVPGLMDTAMLEGAVRPSTRKVPRKPRSARVVPSGRRLHLRLAVVLDTDAHDQVELRLEEIDVFFFGLEDVLENFAAHVVADALAVRDGGLQVRMPEVFELEVALEHFLHVLADHEL